MAGGQTDTTSFLAVSPSWTQDWEMIWAAHVSILPKAAVPSPTAGVQRKQLIMC